MNTEWALTKLAEFVDATAEESAGSDFGAYQRLRGSESDALRTFQVASHIMDRSVPEWRDDKRQVSGYQSGWELRQEWAIRAIAQLEAEEELAANLGPTGPHLDATSLHPWVWTAAAPLWDAGSFQDAVQTASRAVNARAQAKVGRRDLSEWKLLGNAFSVKAPVPGEPRLRLAEADGGDTFVNVHQGAEFFARGCFQGIRNPGGHDELELTEQLALQQLAAFSLLAHWIDSATVETAEQTAH